METERLTDVVDWRSLPQKPTSVTGMDYMTGAVDILHDSLSTDGKNKDRVQQS